MNTVCVLVLLRLEAAGEQNSKVIFGATVSAADACWLQAGWNGILSGAGGVQHAIGAALSF